MVVEVGLKWLLQIPRFFFLMFFVFRLFLGGRTLLRSDFVEQGILSSFICLGVLWGGNKSAKRLQDAKNVG